MAHDNLENWYKTNFSLIQHHKWSGDYIESLIPFERTFYVEMLHEYLEEKKRSQENDF